MWRPSPFRRLVWLVIAGFLIGALYSGVRYGRQATGGAVGASMPAAFFAVERVVLRRNPGGLIRPLPFLPYLGLRTALYVAVMVLINAAVGWLPFGQFIKSAAPPDPLPAADGSHAPRPAENCRGEN